MPRAASAPGLSRLARGGQGACDIRNPIYRVVGVSTRTGRDRLISKRRPAGGVRRGEYTAYWRSTMELSTLLAIGIAALVIGLIGIPAVILGVARLSKR